MLRSRRFWGITLAVLGGVALAVWMASVLLRPRYDTPAEITALMKTQAALTGGAKSYSAHCAYCHDTGFAPTLGGKALPAEAVAAFVRNGPGMMPAFTSTQISNAELADLGTYIAKLPAPEEPQ